MGESEVYKKSGIPQARLICVCLGHEQHTTLTSILLIGSGTTHR